ncbi:Stress response protein ish1 [Cytospora mali]|uniref:Stress response protein ish1 n=1 Tax=Cytospora mali TaxID=578113 RepID=A0A194VI77_CYTMA|nr:Stress response protein ish1 [Valsa mali var. pyri (nom. inval.)]KUI63590.1 Stress response protein ish1 [Valsa mali]
MRFFKTLVSVALVADAAIASSWFSKAAYNKWHETELERWLSDHDIPYPAPADRKDLEKLIQQNWDSYAVSPYKEWDNEKLSSYLQQKGVDVQDSAKANKNSLIAQVKESWYETEDKTQDAYTSVKDWILDTWTDSQLKSFCDHHAIPVPQPRKRDTLLAKARSNYDTVAQKAGETASYPGNWLYSTWTESDLKEWLDTHGFPAPQPTTRDKLIAAVRRNSRLAYLKSQSTLSSATSSAQSAYSTLTDMLIDSWSESQLKEFCDKNSLPVPQGTKLNELRALVRKHRAEILGDTVSNTAASAFGAATSKAGNQYAKATNDASLAVQDAFNQAVDSWSETRLKSYLDARGIPVPHASKTDELRALVRKNYHKAASGWTAWTFDDMSAENLKEYLKKNGDAAAKKTAEKSGATRDELVSAAQSAYTSASSAGGENWASATNYLAQATDSAKSSAFDTWSDSDLKSYLDSYGIPVPQGSKIDELRALARKHSTYFRYGTSTPSGTVFAKLSETLQNTWQWVVEQVNAGSVAAKKTAGDAKEKVKEEL